MSEFDGHLLEYPSISIDRFDKVNYTSSVYFLSHFHKDHIEGLLEKEFLTRLQHGYPEVKLYTSETTRNLMMSDPEATNLLPYVIGLPVHQPTSINLNNESETGASGEYIVVTLISAGHCVGSVMFLFEGSNGAVLYTGDFRLGKEEIEKVKCLHSGSQVIPLKSVYVDTTFLCPATPELPTREQTRDVIIDVIKSWIKKGPQYMIHLKCKGKYGYEYIMKTVAKHFQMKIHVNKWRLRMCEKLPDMLDYFTTNPDLTQIHCCYYGKESTNFIHRLPCGMRLKDGEAIKMMTIVPSSLYFLRNGIPEDFKQWVPSQRLMRVVHSMHASYNEIREVIGYLRVEDIYPFVPPADCHDIWTAYQRLKDLKSLSQSLSQSNSSSKIPPIETEVDNDDSEWKESLRKNFILTPTTAEEHHKKLDIFKRQTSSSPPPRRKRRKKNIPGDVSVIISENAVEKDLDEDQLLVEAFGGKPDGNPDSNKITVREEKDPLEKSSTTLAVPNESLDSTDEDIISINLGYTDTSDQQGITSLKCDEKDKMPLKQSYLVGDSEQVSLSLDSADKDILSVQVDEFDTVDRNLSSVGVLGTKGDQKDTTDIVVISDVDSDATDSDETIVGSSLDGSQEFRG